MKLIKLVTLAILLVLCLSCKSRTNSTNLKTTNGTEIGVVDSFVSADGGCIQIFNDDTAVVSSAFGFNFQWTSKISQERGLLIIDAPQIPGDYSIQSRQIEISRDKMTAKGVRIKHEPPESTEEVYSKPITQGDCVAFNFAKHTYIESYNSKASIQFLSNSRSAIISGELMGNSRCTFQSLFKLTLDPSAKGGSKIELENMYNAMEQVKSCLRLPTPVTIFTELVPSNNNLDIIRAHISKSSPDGEDKEVFELTDATRTTRLPPPDERDHP